MQFLPMGIENRHVFGPVHNWVTTGLPISLRTNYTVIDTCVVLSPYFCVNDELETVLINQSQAVSVRGLARHAAARSQTLSGTYKIIIMLKVRYN